MNLDVEAATDTIKLSPRLESNLSVQEVPPLADAASADRVTVTVGDVTTSIAKREAVTLSVRNLHYAVPKPPTAAASDPAMKTILKDINFDACPGDLLAILGPSGGGKTSLLNVLAGRVSGSAVPAPADSTDNKGQPIAGEMHWQETAGHTVAGNITINGRRRQKQDKRNMAYVLQDDMFLPHLSVRETLTFTAELRMPADTPAALHASRVSEVIQLLGIDKAADNQVGSPHQKTISGGERRRLNVANEMITDPSLRKSGLYLLFLLRAALTSAPCSAQTPSLSAVFLDEPSSGLDSYAALRLFDALAALSRAGRTIITTVHQPTSQLWSRFSKVRLLSEGGLIYCGAPETVLSYIASPHIGLPCPVGWGVADWMLEIANGDSVGKLHSTWARAVRSGLSVPLLTSAGNSPDDAVESAHIPALKSIEDVASAGGAVAPELAAISDDGAAEEQTLSAKEHGSQKWPTSFSRQFVTLAKRAWQNSRGNHLSYLRLGETLSLALVCSLLWWQVPRSASAMEDKIGLMFFIVVYWSFFSLFSELLTFPAERSVIRKERGSGAYRLSAYFLSRSVADVPARLLMPSLFMCIVYWTTNFLPEAGAFFAAWGTLLLHCIVFMGMGQFVGALILDFEKALVTSAVINLTFMLVGGFYVSGIPDWISWINYLSPISYSWPLLLAIEFPPGTELPCNDAEIAVEEWGSCPLTSSDVLDGANARIHAAWANALVLVGLAVFFRVGAYFGLRRSTA